jgi:hypothetical protein
MYTSTVIICALLSSQLLLSGGGHRIDLPTKADTTTHGL